MNWSSLAPFLPLPTRSEWRAFFYGVFTPWRWAKQLKVVWGSANAPLKWALIFSVLVHTVLLGLRFVPEDAFAQWDKEAIQIVLVNAPSDAASLDSKAQVLAQSTLQGGGESEQGMLSSPLPDSGQTQDGDALVSDQRKTQMLEREQAALLSALKSQLQTNTTFGNAKELQLTPGKAPEDANKALMRAVAVLDKKVEDYNAKPRRKQLSPATKEAAYATYYAQWSEGVEKLGTENYPAQAKGKKGEVVLTISIKPSGKLAGIEVMISSGDPALDRAAIKLVKKLAPYQPFKGKLKEKVDILDISTRLIFTSAQAIEVELYARAKP